MVKDYGNIRPRMGRGAGDSCPRSRITGILDFVLGGTLGIPFHGKELRESSTSCGAGRWAFVSTVKDHGNPRPRTGREVGDSFPRYRITGIVDFVWGGALAIRVHGKGLREPPAPFWAGSWGFLFGVKSYGNLREGRGAGDSCPR